MAVYIHQDFHPTRLVYLFKTLGGGMREAYDGGVGVDEFTVGLVQERGGLPNNCTPIPHFAVVLPTGQRNQQSSNQASSARNRQRASTGKLKQAPKQINSQGLFLATVWKVLWLYTPHSAGSNHGAKHVRTVRMKMCVSWDKYRIEVFAETIPSYCSAW